MNPNDFHQMSNIFNLFNQLSETSNDIYEQNILNNVIQQSLLESNPIKNVLSNEGEKQLRRIKYSDISNNMKECPITLLKFKEKDEIIQLPCDHIFDPSGILWWLTKEQASCPVCRQKLKSKEISETKVNTINQNQTNIQTNPLTLFSNITIDLSLNSQLREPYRREYNLETFNTLLDSIEEEDEDDDLFFFNTLQLMQDENEFMSNFQNIFSDISNNV